MKQYKVKQPTNLSSYSLNSDFSGGCIGKSQPNNKHISLNMKSPLLIWIDTQENISVVNNFNRLCNQAHMNLAISMYV